MSGTYVQSCHPVIGHLVCLVLESAGQCWLISTVDSTTVTATAAADLDGRGDNNIICRCRKEEEEQHQQQVEDTDDTDDDGLLRGVFVCVCGTRNGSDPAT